MNALEIQSLHRRFEEGEKSREVLAGVDFKLAQGDFVALLGPSGSGKSTLLNLIAGIDRPDSGRIIVGGRAIEDLAEPDRTLFRRDSIGLVFQFFNLIPMLSVEENVCLPLELAGRADAVGRERARSLLERVGMADRLRTHSDRLSGGEQQRVALARALVTDPALVLADEPTGNLDEESADEVLALLVELAREEHKAVLMVTHSRRAAECAGRRLVLDHGVVREEARA